MRYLLIFSITLTVCFAAQTLALSAVGGRTKKCESNFFSSLARIQTGIQNQPKIMLLGSSMTGRLPDRTMGFDGVSNLGCDGSSAVDTLRAMNQGLLPTAPQLIIEGNTLIRGTSQGSSEISRAINSPWFKAGLMFRNLGATARPTAFAYSFLMSHQLRANDSDKYKDLNPSTIPLIPESPSVELAADESLLVSELSSILKMLKDKGVKVMIVVIPPGGAPDSGAVRLPLALADHAQVPFWDLSSGLPMDAISYTDAIHMSPASATLIMKMLSLELSR